MAKEKLTLKQSLKLAASKEMDFVIVLSRNAKKIFQLEIEKIIQPNRITSIRTSNQDKIVLYGKCNKVGPNIHFELPPEKTKDDLDDGVVKESAKKDSKYKEYIKSESKLSVGRVKFGLYQQFEWEARSAQAELQFNDDQKAALEEIRKTAKASGDYPTALEELQGLMSRSESKITLQSPGVWELSQNMAGLIQIAMGLVKSLKASEDPQAATKINNVKMKSAEFRAAIMEEDFDEANRLFNELSEMADENEADTPAPDAFDTAWPDMKRKCTESIDGLLDDVNDIRAELRELEKISIDTLYDGARAKAAEAIYNNPLEAIETSLELLDQDRRELIKKFVEIDLLVQNAKGAERYTALEGLKEVVDNYMDTFKPGFRQAALIRVVQLMGFRLYPTESLNALGELSRMIQTVLRTRSS